MNRLIFACMALSDTSAPEALMLARSIRAFAGQYADSPIWFLVPPTVGDVGDGIEDGLLSLGVRIVPCQIDEAVAQFPFDGRAFASAEAESLARGQADFLVWMDSDSLVISEPGELALEDGNILGCRPVDLTLISSRYGEPIDSFWGMVYQGCHVPDGRLFPMTTVVDETTIRPHFQAGLLVVRPEHGLLQLWRDRFKELHSSIQSNDLYRERRRHKLFFHQAALAGAVLSSLEQRQIQVLSHLVNYPLHLHSDYPAARKPHYLNEVITCRYGDSLGDPSWREKIPMQEPLASWIGEQLS